MSSLPDKVILEKALDRQERLRGLIIENGFNSLNEYILRIILCLFIVTFCATVIHIRDYQELQHWESDCISCKEWNFPIHDQRVLLISHIPNM